MPKDLIIGFANKKNMSWYLKYFNEKCFRLKIFTKISVKVLVHIQKMQVIISTLHVTEYCS